jgi:hypothetical protein
MRRAGLHQLSQSVPAAGLRERGLQYPRHLCLRGHAVLPCRAAADPAMPAG